LALKKPDEAARMAQSYIPYMVNMMEIQMLKKGATVVGNQPLFRPSVMQKVASRSRLENINVSKSPSTPDFVEVSINANNNNNNNASASDPTPPSPSNANASSSPSGSNAVAVNNANNAAALLQQAAATSLPATPKLEQPNPSTQFADSNSSLPPPPPKVVIHDVDLSDDTPVLLQAEVKQFDFSKFSESDWQKYLFIHIWGLCAAHFIATACQKPAIALENDQLKQLCSDLGDLFSFARFQLQLLCKAFGLQTSWDNFNPTGDAALNQQNHSYVIPQELRNTPEKLLVYTSTYEVADRLRKVLVSQKECDALNLELTQAANKVYINGQRKRFQSSTSGALAAVR